MITIRGEHKELDDRDNIDYTANNELSLDARLDCIEQYGLQIERLFAILEENSI
jgi:hypothetical protein